MMLDVLVEERDLSGGFHPDYTDNVLPLLTAWMRAGERCALVTLVGIDGTAPRALGAQMAVSESGQWCGYISGGCLEQAIALEAADAIEAGRHRLIRYGKGSPYFDIRLPCGSGLDLLIQPLFDARLIEIMNAKLARREAFSLHLDLSNGAAAISERQEPNSLADEKVFVRRYDPSLRCLVIGASPIAFALAEAAACADFETILHVPQSDNLPAISPGIAVRPLMPPYGGSADEWTAAVLAFHDHDREIPVFSELLRSGCFFITAIGSRNAHEARKLALTEAGFSENEIARIISPAGLIPGLKTAPQVATSILAQIIGQARSKAF